MLDKVIILRVATDVLFWYYFYVLRYHTFNKNKMKQSRLRGVSRREVQENSSLKIAEESHCHNWYKENQLLFYKPQYSK